MTTGLRDQVETVTTDGSPDIIPTGKTSKLTSLACGHALKNLFQMINLTCLIYLIELSINDMLFTGKS